jgi:hypothetical protein
MMEVEERWMHMHMEGGGVSNFFLVFNNYET